MSDARTTYCHFCRCATKMDCEEIEEEGEKSIRCVCRRCKNVLIYDLDDEDLMEDLEDE